MSTVALSLRQFRFEFRSYFRNRTGLIFGLAFPLLFLLIFGLGSKGKTTDFNGHQVPVIQFFAPGIVTYGIIGACYTSLAMRLANMRDQGILKRVAGTPLPRASFVGGQILTAVAIGIMVTALTLIAGRLVYDVQFYWHTLPALITAVVVGSAVFCALGVAVSSVIPNADAANGVIQLTIFPVLFISDIFYSVATGPKWLTHIADLLPVRHLANALQIAFDPSTKGTGLNAHHLAVLGVWGVACVVYAARHFKWEAGKS